MDGADSDDRPIGAVVRERRRELGLGQREVALLAGCHLDFVSDLERGKETVRLDKLRSVLAVGEPRSVS